MSTFEQTHAAPSRPASAADSREKRRLVVIKIFFSLAILNNAYIAYSCLLAGGGKLLAGAPAWALWFIGALAVLTIAGAVAGLFWRKIGVYTVVAAGIGATGVSSAIPNLVWAAMFAVGTGFMCLLAHHLWHRFE